MSMKETAEYNIGALRLWLETSNAPQMLKDGLDVIEAAFAGDETEGAPEEGEGEAAEGGGDGDADDDGEDAAPVRTRKTWTEEEDAFIIQHLRAGATANKITEHYTEQFGADRKRPAVLTRIYSLKTKIAA